MWRQLAGGAALALTMTQAGGTRAVEPAMQLGVPSFPRAERVEKTPPKRIAPPPVATLAKASKDRGKVAAAAPEAGQRSGPSERPTAATTEPAPFGLPAAAREPDELPGDDDLLEPAGTAGPERVRHAPEILNRGEMLSLARKYSAEIAQALLDGERQRELAIREKDAIKLACIQDRLSNMKLMKRLADDRLAATERPTIRADELNLRHEFRGVEMAYRRVAELRRELVDCVGQSLQVDAPQGTSPTTVTDPTGTNAEIPRMERPTPASPYN